MINLEVHIMSSSSFVTLLICMLCRVYCRGPEPHISPTGDLIRNSSCSKYHLYYNSISYPTTMFFHVHIPKTGGNTMYTAFECGDRTHGLIARGNKMFACRDIDPQVMISFDNNPHMSYLSCEVAVGGDIQRTLNGLHNPNITLITMIRDPVDHAVSALTHMARSSKRSNRVQMACKTMRQIFDSDNGVIPPCRHYDIRNMQTRVFSATNSPNLTHALAFLQNEVFFFGITGYFRASLCLLSYQLGQLHLHKECDCRLLPKATAQGPIINRAKHAVHPDNIMSREDIVTLQTEYLNFDRVLYHVALRIFLSRIAIAEAMSGITFLCDHTDGGDIVFLKNSITNI